MSRRGHRRNQLSSDTQPSDVTNISGFNGNRSFYQRVALAPSHTASVTWKSGYIKEKEEFERVRQRVRHFAPEMFKGHAKPGTGPADLFPQNVAEWFDHKKASFAMAEAQKLEDIEQLNAQIAATIAISKHQRKLKAVFGKDGKIFSDGFSPVLMLRTIWSAEYNGDEQGIARWPGAAELAWNGDSRQNGQARTKCGRFLPPPRAPTGLAVDFQEQPFIRQLPMDQTGPIFSAGPRPDEMQYENIMMDHDPEFEAYGSALLGSNLMSKVGKWQPTFIPEWQRALQPVYEEQEAQRSYMMQGMAQGFEYELTPDMTGLYWSPQLEPVMTWQEAVNWY